MEFNHYSVLLNESIENLNIKPDGIYVDCTLGGGGHSFEIASRLESGRLIGIDQDEDAIKAAKERLKAYLDKVTIVKSNYEQINKVLNDLGIDKVDGILIDLGVSSYQLDTPDRGFSYMREDMPLDMRMDKSNPFTAKDVVNTYSKEELIQILKDYGEERFAGAIADGICRTRDNKPIETAGQLNEIIKGAIPKKYQINSGHPSKRTFQALRIEVNRELDVLKDTLEDMINLLADDGRICVITFHSLEDRIVKNIFKKCENPCTCPKEFPVCVCGAIPLGHTVNRKPILPSDEELEANSRSKSAKLRVFERNFRN